MLTDHRAADGLREEKHAGQVGRDHRVPFRTRQILEARADAVSGVADEQIDAAELAERAGNRLVHLSGVADVARHGEPATTVRANVRGDRFDGVSTTAACDDIRADLRELDGDRAADALTRAGDD